MLEDHVKSRTACRRLRAGPAAPHVDAFTEWMERQGYRPSYIDLLCQLLATWTDWLLQTELTNDLVAGHDAYVAVLSREGHLRYADGQLRLSVHAASVFLGFLRTVGVLAPGPSGPSPLDTWPLLQEFHGWALDRCGLTPATVKLYEIIVVDLLEALGDDPTTYTAANLRTFVLERACPHGRSRRSTVVTSVRAFLRFLAATGRCREGMDQAVPAFAAWRLSSVPRYLEPEQVQQAIDVCAPSTPTGRRDRAILLLLARLGLRASDVVSLSFVDLDWNNARIAVRGKSRRQEWLPLPQDVGDALIAYLQEGRPALDVPQVFLTVNAPWRPLAPGSLRNITGSALRRAGVAAPSFGAHVFRHSAATAMLRQGVSLAGVSAVLRHRSADTTMQYAKVDFDLLSEVAQPWPEEAPC